MFPQISLLDHVKNLKKLDLDFKIHLTTRCNLAAQKSLKTILSSSNLTNSDHPNHANNNLKNSSKEKFDNKINQVKTSNKLISTKFLKRMNSDIFERRLKKKNIEISELNEKDKVSKNPRKSTTLLSSSKGLVKKININSIRKNVKINRHFTIQSLNFHPLVVI